MKKFPTAKFHGTPLKFIEVDSQAKTAHEIEKEALIRDAKRYRYVREHMFMRPEQFDDLVDDEINGHD